MERGGVCLFGNRKSSPVEVASSWGVKRQQEGVQPAEIGAEKTQGGAAGSMPGTEESEGANVGEAQSRRSREEFCLPGMQNV